MDAVEFIKKRNRMCAFYTDCTNGCPLEGHNCYLLDCIDEYTVSTVDEWSAAHPSRTRQSVFLEQWPEAELTKDGVVSICPTAVSAAYRNKTGGCTSLTRPRCAVCRREFWMQEVAVRSQNRQ